MKYVLMVLVSVMFSSSALAEHSPGHSALCQSLAKHVPAGDVAYKPGVDVRGKAVAPADLNAPMVQAPGKIYIPVEIDLIEKFGLSVDPALKLDTEVALVGVAPDGAVDYNGQDITSNAASVCGLEPGSLPVVTQAPAHETVIYMAPPAQDAPVAPKVKINE
jgi:hypothetical protein